MGEFLLLKNLAIAQDTAVMFVPFSRDFCPEKKKRILAMPNLLSKNRDQKRWYMEVFRISALVYSSVIRCFLYLSIVLPQTNF